MEFRDLKKQYLQNRADIDRAVRNILEGACFIGGEVVKDLEEKLAAYTGARYCVTCANGTDALTLALKVWGIGRGDAVFVPDFTFFSTGECPAGEGAAVYFVDVDERTYNMDPLKLETCIRNVLETRQHTPRAVIAVDLFGQPAEYEKIREVCSKYGLYLLEDGAQGFGGSAHGRRACSFGDISTTSFFPAKPLGCYGDGGALFTDHREWAVLAASLAVHGKNARDKYDNIRIGMNSRLDALQAAILQVKLEIFPKELEAVERIGSWYGAGLADTGLGLPVLLDGYTSSRAQYTIRLPESICRDALQEHLRRRGIPSMIYYRKPMHRQGAFAGTPGAEARCPVTDRLCQTVLSLPIHPCLEKGEVEAVVEAVREFTEREGRMWT